jgi:hypothetical protein
MLNQLQRGNEPELLRCHHSVFLRRPYLKIEVNGSTILDLLTISGAVNYGGGTIWLQV